MPLFCKTMCLSIMQTLYMNLIDPVAQVTLLPLIYPHTTAQRQQALAQQLSSLLQTTGEKSNYYQSSHQC